jgi:hypothetical protein
VAPVKERTNPEGRPMPPIYITFLNRLDIEELALGDE